MQLAPAPGLDRAVDRHLPLPEHRLGLAPRVDQPGGLEQLAEPDHPLARVKLVHGSDHHAVAMELRHLRYFVVVAEELHFCRAAERLHMSQPPLSQQIRALEEEVGATLLLRNQRRVELTAAGAAFFVRAREILGAVEDAALEARRGHRGGGWPAAARGGRSAGELVAPPVW